MAKSEALCTVITVHVLVKGTQISTRLGKPPLSVVSVLAHPKKSTAQHEQRALLGLTRTSFQKRETGITNHMGKKMKGKPRWSREDGFEPMAMHSCPSQ